MAYLRLRSFPFRNGSHCVERRSPVAHAQPFRNPFPSHRGFTSQSFRDSRLRLVPFGPLFQFPLLPPHLPQHSADEPFRLLLFRFPDFGARVRPRPPLPDPIQQFFPKGLWPPTPPTPQLLPIAAFFGPLLLRPHFHPLLEAESPGGIVPADPPFTQQPLDPQPDQSLSRLSQILWIAA